jgi:Cu2+-exporting ATPase
VTQVGPDTRYARIVALMESVSASRPRLARLADRLARPFLLSVLVAAASACAYWWRQDPGHALMVAVAVLVVTCPCALSLATPAAMLAAAGALARRGVLVRRLDAFEALATVDTVMFDKTGTLTRDGLALAGTQVRAGMTGALALAQAVALARHSLHPASRALMAAFTSQQTSASPTDWLALAVTETAGGGVSARVGYAPEGRDAIEMRLGSAAFCRLVQPESSLMQVFLADAQGWLATFDLQEDLRPDARATVQALAAAGISVHLLSGDRPLAVARVAQSLGIASHAGACTPQHKLDFLRGAQQSGRRVAMVGDGLNDGPVLAGAQVSFAFGQAVPLAQAKADFVVPGSQLLAVAQALGLHVRQRELIGERLSFLLCQPGGDRRVIGLDQFGIDDVAEGGKIKRRKGSGPKGVQIGNLREGLGQITIDRSRMGQQIGAVLSRAGQNADMVKRPRQGHNPVHGDQALGRLVPHHAAEAGGNAHAAKGISAQCTRA